MTGPQLLKGLSTVLVLLTSICYLYQILYLFLPQFKKASSQRPPKATRYAILIPARNEEAVLPYLLESIRNQDYPASLITTFVIADNCTDRTAEVAAAGGAVVYTRFNRQNVGKGYALQYLLSQIEADTGLDRYDAFLVFDADNLLQKDYISQINRVCSDGCDAFCGYRNTKNFGTNWITSGYAIWHLHESTHMNRSRMLLGSCCLVSGTGFGFTRQLLEQIGGWRFFTLTEDTEFNTWCAVRGIRIGYCHDAILYDEQPLTFRQSWRQRTRWAQGNFQVSARYAGDIAKGLFRGGRATCASFETATLSMWGMGLSALCLVVSLCVTQMTAGWFGFFMALLQCIINSYLTLFVIGAWTMATEHRRIRGTFRQKLRALFTFPLFMLTYVPIALAAVFQKFEWHPIAHTVAIAPSQLSDTDLFVSHQ